MAVSFLMNVTNVCVYQWSYVLGKPIEKCHILQGHNKITYSWFIVYLSIGKTLFHKNFSIKSKLLLKHKLRAYSPLDVTFVT